MEGYPFPIESPYSGNKLPGFLHKETKDLPLKVALMKEIRSRRIAMDDEDRPVTDETNIDEDSVDFVHLRLEFLGQLNRLLAEHFWPLIDVRESLDWPEFTIVLLYRKLVIGCGIANPDGYLSYLFVHPEWRSTGLATTLLYLMVSKLLPANKDVTAHVAVGNPAVLLYQKFGFKPEEFIVDFYGGKFRKVIPGEKDKYEPTERNAFFMRLKR